MKRYNDIEEAYNYLLTSVCKDELKNFNVYKVKKSDDDVFSFENTKNEYIVSLKDEADGKWILNTHGRVLTAYKILIEQGINLKDLGAQINGDCIEFYDSIDIVVNQSPWFQQYSRLQLDFYKSKKILKCKGEYNSVNRKFVGKLYPNIKTKGFYLKITSSEQLKLVSKFCKDHSIQTKLGEDESKLFDFNKQLTIKWEEFMFSYQLGIVYNLDEVSRFVKKVPCFRCINNKLDMTYEEISSNYIVFDIKREIEEWKCFVLEDFEKFKKVNKVRKKRKRISSSSWEDPTSSKYYNSALDMDQQSQDFWEDI